MGKASSPASFAEAQGGAPGEGPPHRHQRHPMDPSHRRTVERPTTSVRLLEDGLQQVSPLAGGGHLAEALEDFPATGGRRRRLGLGDTLRRQHGGSGPPARSRGKRGQKNEALGRSRGGFSTKVHVRAEGFGKPLVFVLTGGERHEEVAFECLMEGGKVK